MENIICFVKELLLFFYHNKEPLKKITQGNNMNRYVFKKDFYGCIGLILRGHGWT